MRGTILWVDETSGAGVLRAEDGRRYRFSLSQWRDASALKKGDGVDFEPDEKVPGNTTGDIYRIVSWRTRITSQNNKARVRALLSWFRERPESLIALALMLSCVLPVYRFLDFEASIFAIPSLVERLELGLGRIRSMVLDVPEASTAAAALRAIMPIVYVLWIVPILSLVLLHRTLAGKPRRVLAVVVGLLAVVLPAALPFAIAVPTTLMVLSQLPTELRASVSTGIFDVTSPDLVREIAYGSYVMMLLGFALLLWGFSPPREARPIRKQTQPDTAARPVAPRLRARQPAAEEISARQRKPLAPSANGSLGLPEFADDDTDPLPKVLTRRKRRQGDTADAPAHGTSADGESHDDGASGPRAGAIAKGWEVQPEGRFEVSAPVSRHGHDPADDDPASVLPNELRGSSHEPESDDDEEDLPEPTPARFEQLVDRLRDLIDQPPPEPSRSPAPRPEEDLTSVNGSRHPQPAPEPAETATIELREPEPPTEELPEPIETSEPAPEPSDPVETVEAPPSEALSEPAEAADTDEPAEPAEPEATELDTAPSEESEVAELDAAPTEEPEPEPESEPAEQPDPAKASDSAEPDEEAQTQDAKPEIPPEAAIELDTGPDAILRLYRRLREERLERGKDADRQS